MNSGAEGAEKALKMGFFFTTQMANECFSAPLDALIPKIPFLFFAEFWVRVTSGVRQWSHLGGGGGAPEIHRNHANTDNTCP